MIWDPSPPGVEIRLDHGLHNFGSEAYKYKVYPPGYASWCTKLPHNRPSAPGPPNPEDEKHFIIFLYGADQSCPFVAPGKNSKNKRDYIFHPGCLKNWDTVHVFIPQHTSQCKQPWKEQAPTWIVEFARNLRRFKPVSLVLVGFSRGGWWACDYFTQHPDVFSGMVSIGGYPAVANNQAAEEGILAAKLIEHPYHSLWIMGADDTLSSVGAYPAFHRALESNFDNPQCKCKFHLVLQTEHQPLFNALLRGSNSQACRIMWEFLKGKCHFIH